MNNLEIFANDNQYILNQDWEKDDCDCIILACCNVWECQHLTHTNRFDYQKYTIHDSPSIFITMNKKIVNVKNIVQQCYVVHDHIVPTKEDQSGIKRLIQSWPQYESFSNWPTTRIEIDEELELDSESKKCLPFCGVSWQCRDHEIINCHQCINQGINKRNGSIVYDCVENNWPYYKAYTIYQGYVNRLFNSRRINELGW